MSSSPEHMLNSAMVVAQMAFYQTLITPEKKIISPKLDAEFGDEITVYCTRVFSAGISQHEKGYTTMLLICIAQSIDLWMKGRFNSAGQDVFSGMLREYIDFRSKEYRPYLVKFFSHIWQYEGTIFFGDLTASEVQQFMDAFEPSMVKECTRLKNIGPHTNLFCIFLCKNDPVKDEHAPGVYEEYGIYYQSFLSKHTDLYVKIMLSIDDYAVDGVVDTGYKTTKLNVFKIVSQLAREDPILRKTMEGSGGILNSVYLKYQQMSPAQGRCIKTYIKKTFAEFMVMEGVFDIPQIKSRKA
jgi:hypothetical protein